MAYPRLSVKQQPNILFYMERCLIITNQQAITNKQAASLEDYNFFSCLHQISIFYMLMEAFRKTVKMERRPEK